MVELATTLGGHQDSWELRFVGPGRHCDTKAKTFHSLFEYDPVGNIMSVHPCSGLSDNVAAFIVILTLQ